MYTRFFIATYVIFYAVFSAGAQVIRNPYSTNSNTGTYQQRQQQLQQQQLPQQQQQAMMPFDVSGTIEALASGRIQIHTDSNEKWMIAMTPKTNVQVTGEVGADFLRPGMFVQLNANVDKRGVAPEKVDELTIVSQLQEKPSAFEGGKPSATGPSNVQGRITSFKKNKLQLKLDKGTLLLELSDNPRIHLDLADFSMVKKGDRIKVQGIKMTGMNSVVQAAHVNIQLAEPQGVKKKK